jgi:hypothetical protein
MGNCLFVVDGKWPSVEKLVQPGALKRLTMPKSQSPELRRLLWAERVSRAHLMPSLDNVTHALEAVWGTLAGTQPIQPKSAD